MSDSAANAIYDLTYAYGVQLRFNGMLMHLLIEKDILTLEQARAMLEDVASKLPEDNALGRAYDELLAEFR